MRPFAHSRAFASAGGLYAGAKPRIFVPSIERIRDGRNIYQIEFITCPISFKWASDASEQVWIGCNSAARDSTLTSPPNSPAYPIPEPLTIVLISTGLLMLAGYAYMDRRNR